jgi:tRNA pseudouridine55 synthase
MRGFLNIDKPTGMTSFDVVRAVRRAAGVKRVGHAGTLDPLATGVLPVAIGGEATRLIDALVGASKRYVAEVTLGAETTTDDSEGEVVASADASEVTAAAVASALETFVGTHPQLPPAYSAIKVAGVPAYRAARKGEAHDLALRVVVAYALTLVTFEAGRCVIEVHCGKGYYVRSLARDLGRMLGVYGHVSALRRTAVGPFAIARAVPLADAVSRLQAGDIATMLHAPDAVLTDWPAVLLGSDDIIEVRLGRPVTPEPRLDVAPEATLRARAYGPDGRLVALVEPAEGRSWHPYRVFADETASQ